MPERIETLVLGSGNGGMYLAWHVGKEQECSKASNPSKIFLPD